MIGQGLAVCAGACAAMASVCAKLAMASPATLGLCKASKRLVVDYARGSGLAVLDNIHGLLPPCEAVVTYVRLSFFGLIFLFNTLMWTLFTKSLQKCSTTVEATVTNTASNLIFSALMGQMLFGEVLSMMWLVGVSLIVAGLALIHTASDPTVSKEATADTKFKQS